MAKLFLLMLVPIHPVVLLVSSGNEVVNFVSSPFLCC